MNLFNNLKETFSNVTKDLTSSGNQSKSSRFKNEEKVPGQELLSSYVQNWKELCLNTDSMAKQAEVCDKTLTKLTNDVVYSKNVASQFCSELLSVDKIVTDVLAITIRIADLNKTCGRMEEMLVELEGLNLQCQHLAVKERMERNFNAHRQNRLKEHERSRRLLAEEHKNNLQKIKVAASRKKMEKQREYEDAHKKDMENYKIFGAISNTAEHKDTKLHMELSQISLDGEHERLELEEFLASSEVHPNNEDCGVVHPDQTLGPPRCRPKHPPVADDIEISALT